MEASASRTCSLRDHWALLPILVLAALLRLWQINESLWLDELHSAWVVSSGATEIVERAQIGNQSPLYFYLPWLTTSLCGTSEWALRLPSLAAGVGLVAVAYGLAFRFTCSRIAAGACSLLAALDHNFLFYATEARPYACVQLVAAAQLFIFFSLDGGATRRRRLAFILSSVVLFYLHYTAVLLVTGGVVYLATRSCCRRHDACTYRSRDVAVDLVCVAAMMLPVTFHLLNIGSRRGAWASFINNTSLLLPAHWFSLVSYVVVPIIACLLIGLIKGMITFRRGAPFSLGLAAAATSAGASTVSSSSSSRRSLTTARGAAYLLVCWFCAPLAIVWLLTVTKVAPLYLGRYVIGAALAPILFVGLCVGVWSSKKIQVLVAGLSIVCGLFSSGMIDQLRYDGRLFGDRRENWRDAVRYVNQGLSPDSLVFVRSGFLEADRLATDDSELLRDYCVSPVTSLYQIDRPAAKIRPLTTRGSGKLTISDVEQIEASRSAWFIIHGTTATRESSAARVLDSLSQETGETTRAEAQHGRVLLQRQFGGVGTFLVLLEKIEAPDRPLDLQPTSPNSIAPP